jgi:hypothetical protein
MNITEIELEIVLKEQRLKEIDMERKFLLEEISLLDNASSALVLLPTREV